jgi:tRNA pseudouridine32 synthase / 23S rRNA pseudouridine746 synthase
MTAAKREPIPIVAQTDRWVVIDKPAGMLAVPGRGPDKQDCAIARVRAMFPGATGPMVVHRLDMDTSGLMIVALDAPTQRAMSMQFENRAIEKQYEAILEGALPMAPTHGEIRLKQRLDVDRRPLQIVDEEQGKLAITRWRIIEPAAAPTARTADTRIEFSPITGRSHQLRLAAATPPSIGLGCPIVGDDLYGSGKPEDGRLMLAATMLAFTDPDTDQRVVLSNPAPFTLAPQE